LRPLVICAPTTEPAEVPMIRSASVTPMPTSWRPKRRPISQAIPVVPPPPRTSAFVGWGLRQLNSWGMQSLGSVWYSPLRLSRFLASVEVFRHDSKKASSFFSLNSTFEKPCLGTALSRLLIAFLLNMRH